MLFQGNYHALRVRLQITSHLKKNQNPQLIMPDYTSYYWKPNAN